MNTILLFSTGLPGIAISRRLVQDVSFCLVPLPGIEKEFNTLLLGEKYKHRELTW